MANKKYEGELLETYSFDDYLKDYKKLFSEINKLEYNSIDYRTKLNEESIKKINNLRKDAVYRLQQLELSGVKLTEEAKSALLSQYRKEQEKEEEKQRVKNTKQVIEDLKKQQKEAKKLKDKAKQEELKKEIETQKKALENLQEDFISEVTKKFSGGILGALEDAKNGEKSPVELINQLGKVLGNMINTGINSYVSYQKGVNARLQGTTVGASPWWKWGANLNPTNKFTSVEANLTSAIGINPYVKTENVLSNLSNLVSLGVASNLEQRAFLQTIKDEIATTFDVANSSLLRIVRLQQADSTAARLGLEAYLTDFLNRIDQNTEYLTTTFDNVQAALLEASSLMTTQAATEMEYVVQKWLGSLVGKGFSEQTATGLATALGYLGSGNVEALFGNQYADLLVMAASRAGLDYGSLLTGGVSSTDANRLMGSLVSYLAQIGGSSNNVVKSSYAKTFGVSVSDLVAAGNVVGSLGEISNSMMSFADMYSELEYQMSQLPWRMSAAQMTQNLIDNAKFGLASNIANNPILAATWAINDLIEKATGGINIPSVGALGNFIDVNANLNQLIKLGLVGVSSLGLIGDVISGIGSTFAPASMLSKLGISSNSYTLSRGSAGLRQTTGGVTTSISTTSYIGGTSGADLQKETLAREKEPYQSISGEDKSTNIVSYLSGELQEDNLIWSIDSQLSI